MNGGVVLSPTQRILTVVCGAAFPTITALIGILSNQSASNSLRNDIKSDIQMLNKMFTSTTAD
jgi:hypothetical protein